MRNELKNILKNERQNTTLGIRGENRTVLEIGETLKTSYAWDFETDQSSYNTDNPVELGGVCATRVYSDNWIVGFVDTEDEEEMDELIDEIMEAYENHKSYRYSNVYLVIGKSIEDGSTVADDPDETILADAKVLYKF